MSSLVYFIACTLDGFIAGGDGSTDFLAFDGPHIRDLLAEFPEVVPGHLRAPLGVTAGNQRFDTVLMGRATYQPALDAGITSPYPHLRQIVASTSMTSSLDPAVELVRSDVVGRIRALKAGAGKDIWLCGGGQLAATVADEIDEVILKINPIVLGAGIPLFAGQVGPRPATLTDHSVYPNGCVVARYGRG